MAQVDTAGLDHRQTVYSSQRLEIISRLGVPQGKDQPRRGATQVRC